MWADHVPAGGTQGIGLGFAPALCNGLGEVGEEAGQPQDDRNGQDKAAGDNAVGDTAQERENKTVVRMRGEVDQEHDRVFDLVPGGELVEGILHSPAHHRMERRADLSLS